MTNILSKIDKVPRLKSKITALVLRDQFAHRFEKLEKVLMKLIANDS